MVGERIAGALSRTMVASTRHPWVVVGLVALVSTGALAAVLLVEPNVETDIQAGYFGRNDETANAFRELRREVAGLNSEIVYFELQRGATAPNGEPVDNVTDYHALEAQDELFSYVKRRFLEETGEDKVISYTGLPYFVKLVYNAYPGGCFCIPEDPVQLASALEILYAAGGESPHLYRSDDWRSAVIFIVYDPAGNKKATGGLINELIAEYRERPVGERGGKAYDLWDEAYLDSWGAQSWIYRIDESVEEDSRTFIPLVFLFLTGALIAAFRDVKRALIGTTTVGIILLWTLAVMTIGDVAIGFISMAMFPLLLGVGVDYVIHIINEYSAELAELKDHEAAMATVGGKGAIALLVTSLTTATGFLVMMSSTSPMIVEIGTATVFGIWFIFLLAITFVPAMLTVTSREAARVRETFRPSYVAEGFARWASNHRAVVAVVLLVITGIAIYYIPQTKHVIGTVEINLPSRPEKSHMLVMYERFQERMDSTGQEFIIQEGDMTDPAVIDEIIGVHRAMAAEREAFGGSPISLPFVLNLYEVLKDGIESAAPALGQDVVFGGAIVGEATGGAFSGTDEDYQTDFSHVDDLSREELEADLDAMWNDPVWTSLVRTFTDEDYRITWTLTFVTIPVTQAATEEAEEAMIAVLDEVEPTESEAHFFGTMTGVKRYNDYTDFWLFWSSVAAFAIVTTLVGLFTRRLKAVAAVALPMGLSFIWWTGSLPSPALDIDIAFVFLIPIAFITSLGSDYAVHMIMNFERTGDRPWVYRTVGKAILYSAFTTGGAFLLFTRGAIRGSWEMFEASVAAIVIITVATLLAMPLIYRLGQEPGAGGPLRVERAEPAELPPRVRP